MTVCLCGHRDTPDNAGEKLEQALSSLLSEHTTLTVLLGRQGNFDRTAAKILRKIKNKYSSLTWYIVLEKIPHKEIIAEDTILPEGIETVFPRFAIKWRNRWMVDNSDLVITYMTRSAGGTAQLAKYALSQGKRVINLAEKSLL